MKSAGAVSFALLTGVLLLAGASMPRAIQPHRGVADGTQVINVTAKKYEFQPNTIRVKQGTRVQLRITASDHAHGMKISEVAEGADPKAKPGLIFSGPQDCTKIEEGKTETVDFVADAAGTYPFRCCVHCGWHHRAMKGAVVVEP